MAELTKEKRISAEKERLSAIFQNLDGDKKVVAEGLIERSAHLRIAIEDFEKDLETNGYTEMFQQGKDNKPYERKRPSAEMHVSYMTVYMKNNKQLLDLLPKPDKASKSDELLEFIGGGRV